MSRVNDNSYLGKGILSGSIASMSYNIGQYDNVAYQIHTITRASPGPQFVIGAPTTTWRVLHLDGTPNLGVPVIFENIAPGPEEKEAEIDAGLPAGPTVGNIKLQQSNDNIQFADVPDYTSNVADNGDLIFTITNPLALWHRLFMVINSSDIGFTVRVCARVNTAQSE